MLCNDRILQFEHLKPCWVLAFDPCDGKSGSFHDFVVIPGSVTEDTQEYKMWLVTCRYCELVCYNTSSPVKFST